MLYTNTVSVGSTAVKLTSSVNTDERFTLTVRVPGSGSLGSSPLVRIGSSGVSSSNGFSLDSQAPAVTLVLEGGDDVWAISAQASSFNVDVLAYSG